MLPAAVSPHAYGSAHGNRGPAVALGQDHARLDAAPAMQTDRETGARLRVEPSAGHRPPAKPLAQLELEGDSGAGVQRIDVYVQAPARLRELELREIGDLHL